VFDASEHFNNVCHAAARGKLQTLSRHGLPDGGVARLFTDSQQSDFYLLDAHDTHATITLKFRHTLAAGGAVIVDVVGLARACENKTNDGLATPNRTALDTNTTGSPLIINVLLSPPGKYIVNITVVGLKGSNQTCAEYDISGESHAPICSDHVPPCSLRHCFSARECSSGASLRGCDSLRSRCIESTYGDDHDDDDERNGDLSDVVLHNDHFAPLVERPSRAKCVCDGARDGTPCVNTTASGVAGTCSVGACKNKHCVVKDECVTFDCGCVCKPHCHVDADCNDGDPHTDDFCLRATHQCVNSRTIERTSHSRTSRHSTPAPTSTTATTTGVVVNGTVGLATGAPVRASFVAAAVGAHVATEADRRCARLALDAAERTYAAASMDRVGSFDADGHRLTPLCSAAQQSGASIELLSNTPLTPLESSECCASPTLRSYCLGGAQSLTRDGQSWSDAAWSALDSAHREAQAGAANLAIRDACCAAMIYEAMGVQCGRAPDQWALASTSVVRIEEFGDVGARCMAADDGHPDKDLNDFVFELRRVELRRGSVTVAINVHTLPLAHGGGHHTSLVVATGNGLSLAAASVNNDECPPRLSAAMPVAESAELLERELGYGTPALGAGSFGEVVRHSLHDDGLPHAAGQWAACVTFGPIGTSYCPRADVLPLYDNTRSPLPLTHPDALERLASGSSAYREATTNTQRGTRRVRALFGASATIVPRPASERLVVGAVRLLMRNEDCGVTALLDSPQMVGAYEMPLSIAVPASACAGWRWAAEGVPVFAVPSTSASRWCRGGADSALEQCSGLEGQCAEGGTCAPSVANGRVPYPYGWTHFQCAARGVDCEVSGADAACCKREVRRWYETSTPALLYAEEE